MKTHNSTYRVLMTIGMVVLASLGVTIGISSLEFLLSSPFDFFSNENRGTLLKAGFGFLIGLSLLLIASVGTLDTYFDHRGG